jgi:2Fe-2S ferredoxin
LKLLLTDREGGTREIDPPEGVTLMEALRLCGADEILALCGGSCSCATCHVFIDPGYEGQLPALSDDESDLLDTSDHREARSRLSCQIPLKASFAGMQVTIAPED